VRRTRLAHREFSSCSRKSEARSSHCKSKLAGTCMNVINGGREHPPGNPRLRIEKNKAADPDRHPSPPPSCTTSRRLGKTHLPLPLGRRTPNRWRDKGPFSEKGTRLPRPQARTGPFLASDRKPTMAPHTMLRISTVDSVWKPDRPGASCW